MTRRRMTYETQYYRYVSAKLRDAVYSLTSNSVDRQIERNQTLASSPRAQSRGLSKQFREAVPYKDDATRTNLD